MCAHTLRYCIWDKTQTNYGYINPHKDYHKNHVAEQHGKQYMGHALWTTAPSHLNVVWSMKSEGSGGRKEFHRQMNITSYQIERMWLQALATEGGMIALSKRSCPGINKQRHAEENTNTHPHGVLGVWRTLCERSGRYKPSTKELKPDCSDNTATAFISHGMSAWQHLPPHTHINAFLSGCECVYAREEVSGHWIYIHLHAGTWTKCLWWGR